MLLEVVLVCGLVLAVQARPSQAPTAIDLGGRVVDDAKRPLATAAVSLGDAPLKAPQSLQAAN